MLSKLRNLKKKSTSRNDERNKTTQYGFLPAFCCCLLFYNGELQMNIKLFYFEDALLCLDDV